MFMFINRKLRTGEICNSHPPTNHGDRVSITLQPVERAMQRDTGTLMGMPYWQYFCIYYLSVTSFKIWSCQKSIFKTFPDNNFAKVTVEKFKKRKCLDIFILESLQISKF